jgi:hypothetical protein
MPTNDYHFITHWRVPGTVAEVVEILGDAPGLARWWPSVYLSVKQLAPGDAHGLGKVVDLYTKGWLPYRLRWQFKVTEIYDDGFRLDATGDFVGRGIWTFVQDGPDVLVRYDWKILAEKPLLRDFSFIMKPIFGANHRWAMGKGEESLKLELARRHAGSTAERALIPAPPPATKVPVGMVVFGLLATAAVVWLATRRRRG